MQKLTELLTTEQQEILKNVYIISNDVIIPLVDGNEPTRDTLKVIVGDTETGVVVLEAKDFEFWDEDEDDHDFRYYLGEVDYYVSRDETPMEVVNVLDDIILEAMEDPIPETEPVEVADEQANDDAEECASEEDVQPEEVQEEQNDGDTEESITEAAADTE